MQAREGLLDGVKAARGEVGQAASLQEAIAAAADIGTQKPSQSSPGYAHPVNAVASWIDDNRAHSFRPLLASQ